MAEKNIFIARQAIVDFKGDPYGYELLYRDSPYGIENFPSNRTATANVLMNALSNVNLNTLLGPRGKGFVNIDAAILKTGVLDLLDPNRFILEILETTEITDEVLKNIIKKGLN